MNTCSALRPLTDAPVHTTKALKKPKSRSSVPALSINCPLSLMPLDKAEKAFDFTAIMCTYF